MNYAIWSIIAVTIISGFGIVIELKIMFDKRRAKKCGKAING